MPKTPTKTKPTVGIYPAAAVGWGQLVLPAGTPKRAALLNYLKMIPGPIQNRHGVLIPDNVHTLAVERMHDLGIKWVQLDASSAVKIKKRVSARKRLRPFQQANVELVHTNRGRVILAHEMRLGKSAPAIVAIAEVWQPTDLLLIACPAQPRATWAKEIKKWWRRCPPIIILNKKAKATRFLWNQPDTAIVIAGFDQLETLAEYPLRPNHIILDEAHNVKDARSAQAKNFRKIRNGLAPHGYFIELTATPMDRPQDLYNQLDLLTPASFSDRGAYMLRYCEEDEDTFFDPSIQGERTVTSPGAARQENLPELQARLATFMSRELVEDHPELMPEIYPEAESIKAPKVDLSGPIDPALFAAKAKTIYEVLAERVPAYLAADECVMILCYHTEVAKEIGDLFGTTTDAIVTGTMLPERRIELLDELQGRKHGALAVASMESLCEGLSLPGFHRVIVVELSRKLIKVLQALARYRVPGGLDVIMQFLMIAGTYEEQIAKRLCQKLADENAILKQTAMGGAIKKSLGVRKSDIEWIADLEDDMVVWGDDVYLGEE